MGLQGFSPFCNLHPALLTNTLFRIAFAGTGDGLDVPAFIRLVHDCGLDDRGLTRPQAEEVFLAVKQPGATHLAYTDFLLSLDRIGAS